jgi:uncharacterized protein YbbC (DUF1343 family)
LAALLNSRFIPGFRCYPTRFQPASSNLSGQSIEGVRFLVTDREAFDSGRLGLEIAAAIRKLYSSSYTFTQSQELIGSRRAMGMIEAGRDPSLIQQDGEESLRGFLKLREQYLLYR